MRRIFGLISGRRSMMIGMPLLIALTPTQLDAATSSVTTATATRGSARSTTAPVGV